MANHSAGPWVAHQYGVRHSGGYLFKFNWPHLYDGQDERYWRETAERQADARLIAAAPDMLAALQLVYRNCTRADWADDIYGAMEKAITKATTQPAPAPNASEE